MDDDLRVARNRTYSAASGVFAAVGGILALVILARRTEPVAHDSYIVVEVHTSFVSWQVREHGKVSHATAVSGTKVERRPVSRAAVRLTPSAGL